MVTLYTHPQSRPRWLAREMARDLTASRSLPGVVVRTLSARIARRFSGDLCELPRC